MSTVTALSLVTDALEGWDVVRQSDPETTSEGFEAFAHDCIEGTLECFRDDDELTREQADELWAAALSLVTSIVGAS